MTKHLFFALLLVSSQTLFGQVFNEVPLDNSPLSHIGLGDFVPQNMAAANGFGGLSAAFNDPYNLNVINPAASSSLKSTSYEVGIYGKYGTVKDTKTSLQSWSGNINYLALGFPLRNQINELLDKRQQSKMRHGMHLALMPYTTVGYLISSTQRNATDTTLLTYQGKGGTYKMMWGNSVGYKGFSAGVNIGFFFGTNRYERSVNFLTLKDEYENDIKAAATYRGFVWNLGVQYTYEFMKKVGKKDEKSGKKLHFGLYGNPATKFAAESNQVVRRINYSYFGSGNYIDTLSGDSKNAIEGTGKLPAELGLGLIYEKENKLRVGINYSTVRWSTYKNTLDDDKLSNAYTVSAGLEYTPEYNSYNKYTRRIRYRVGAHLGTDPRSVAGEQVTNNGINFGFGFPLVMPRQQVSFLNITFDVGKIGTPKLSDNYAKVTLGFTLNDNSWFYKRRYN